MLKNVTAGLALFIFCVSATANQTLVEKRFPVTTFGDLLLKVPADWEDISVVGKTGGKAPSMIEFMGKDSVGRVQFKLLPIVPPLLKAETLTDAGLKSLLERTSKQYVAGSVEGKITPVVIDGPHAHGFMYTLTDGSKDAGAFKCVSGGVFKIGDFAVLMTLMHQPEQPAMTAAIDAVRNATMVAAAPPSTAPANSKSVVLDAPDGKWKITMPDYGAGELTKEVGQGGRMIKYTSLGDAVELTAFFEPAAKPNANATDVRTFYLDRMKKNGMPGENFQLSGDGSRAILRYTMFGQPSIHAYFSNNGIWVDVHLSFDANDKKSAQRVGAAVEAMHIQPTN